MAIYGLAVNGSHIPPELKKHFPLSVKLPHMGRGEAAQLEGVVESPKERDIVIEIGTRPGRGIHARPHRTPKGIIYGMYSYRT
jgi:hypothetical protein